MRRTPIEVDAGTQEEYVRAYELNPGFHFTVVQEGGTLYLQATGQEPIVLQPFSETEYFAGAVKAEVVFVRDEAGSVIGLTFRQNDREMRADRVG